MKKIMLLAIGMMLACGSVEAQNFLQRLGRAVEKSVTKEISNAVAKEVRKGLSGENANRNNQQSEPVPAPAPAQQQPETMKSAPVAGSQQKVDDRGQGVPREAGLDYVDEWGINHGGGILIGEVLWAPVNCGYHAEDYPYGKLFQWGRKHGQGYGAPYQKETDEVRPDKTTADITPAPVTPAEARKHPNRFYARSDMALFNWTSNDMKLWNNFTDDGIVFKNTDNDPCPKGWRLPELFDFYSLATNYSNFVQHPDTGQWGRWFSGPNPYGPNVPRIFLPATGLRTRDGASYARDKGTHYWSLRHAGGEGLIWNLYFCDDEVDVTPSAFPHEAFAVRCVKDIEGQRMR